MHLTILIPLLTAASLWSPSVLATQPAVQPPAASPTTEPEPRWTWTKGRTARYLVTQVAEARGDGMLAYSVSQRQEQRLLMIVTDVSPSGDATIDLTLESISIAVVPAEGAKPVFVASTQRPTNEEQNPSGVCHALVGLTLTLVVSPTGEVREIRGLDTLQARVRKAFAEPAALAALATDVLGSLSEDRLRAAFEPMLRLTPDSSKQQPVPIAVKGLGTLTRQTSLATSAKAGLVTAHRTTDFALASPNTDEIAKAFDVTLTDAREECEAVLDPSASVIRTSTSTLSMTTTLTPKQTAAGIGTNTRRVTQTLSIELVTEPVGTPAATPPEAPGTP